MKRVITLLIFVQFSISTLPAQHSIARIWNEVTLDAIRGDQARPTIHARNLFHTSIAMYDAWAIFGEEAETYFLGKTVHGFNCGFSGMPVPDNIQAAREEAISFAVYRLLEHRFIDSPGAPNLIGRINFLMDSLGFDHSNISINYKCGAAELGNYLAAQLIEYGLQDGANESGNYENLFYEPVNPSLRVAVRGNRNILDLNRWQPLEFSQFIGQSGVTGENIPPFVSPEWGQVLPFSLNREEANIYERDGNNYWVYHDPGPPPYLDTLSSNPLSEEYKWGFSMVSAWSSLLDPADEVMIDISPASVGNIIEYPSDLYSYHDFYDFFEGGDTGMGYEVNPKTGEPYSPQIVHRADYARVLAEFWADGPDSETPPGHWFSIFNYVSDHPQLEKKLKGTGEVLSDLEWDVKGYFILGGAMHDAAISVWGIKGWYDYVRPVSSIRGMAELGQSTDQNLPNYHPGGLPLIPDFIELIENDDPLAGAMGEYVGKIKLKAWRGPSFITNPLNDVAGVGWIRADFWWPYQRPTFVSPPFAGYISGHSTFSRAAAEILTLITGDPYFPGGMGEFHCPKNEFLVFEDGPSTDLTLQWAKYQDASDQCSLSRIYGGIHPPADDIPGRKIGFEIGQKAFEFAEAYFTKESSPPPVFEEFNIFPNPTDCIVQIDFDYEGVMPINVFSSDGKMLVFSSPLEFINKKALLDLSHLQNGSYIIVGFKNDKELFFKQKVILLKI